MKKPTNMFDEVEIPRLYTLPEVSQILKVSRSLVYRMAQQGEIPSIRFGRAIRVRPEDLKTFIQNSVSSGYGIRS